MSNFFAEVRFHAERADLNVNPTELLVFKKPVTHGAARIERQSKGAFLDPLDR